MFTMDIKHQIIQTKMIHFISEIFLSCHSEKDGQKIKYAGHIEFLLHIVVDKVDKLYIRLLIKLYRLTSCI